MSKTQSPRAVAARMRRAERAAQLPTCPTHGHTLNTNATRYGESHRYMCGCLSTLTRN